MNLENRKTGNYSGIHALSVRGESTFSTIMDQSEPFTGMNDSTSAISQKIAVLPLVHFWLPEP